MLFTMHIKKENVYTSRSNRTKRKTTTTTKTTKSIFFLSEAHLFPSNFAAEANNFSHRAAKFGQFGNNVPCLQQVHRKEHRLMKDSNFSKKGDNIRH